MTYDKNDIRELIRQGENHAVEFKSSQVHADSLAKEIKLSGLDTRSRLADGVERNSTTRQRTDFKEFGEEFRVTLPL